MARQTQVDSMIPRGKAAFHTIIPALTFVLLAAHPFAGGVVLGLTGAAMALSVAAGSRVSLFGLLFTRAVRPALHIGPGKPEQATPHRFAEAVGAVALLAAAALLLSGLVAAGWTLTLLVVALAALNWLAGICVGCQMYLAIRRLSARGHAAA
jgi:uncharacterized protein DUF4395